MARSRPTRDLTIGAFFALALIVLALAVMAVGGESGLFLERTGYSIVFPDATGLLVGAPVRMAGVEVGTVTEIRLPTDPGGEGIGVHVGIQPGYTERIREDSRATLRILQLLTNEKFVEITPGTPLSPPLAPETTIPLLKKIDVFERGETIAEDFGEITIALKNILGALEKGEGILGQMLHDPDFGRQGLEALGATLTNLEALSGRLAQGQGVAGRLLADDSLGQRLDDLALAIEDFSAVMQSIRRGDGAVGELLEEDGAGQQAIRDLRDTTASLKRLAERLERPEGLLGALLNDPDYSEALAADLGRTFKNLAEITEKINTGEGTLGALVNDRVLYDGAEDVIAGVNDSKFARWLARHYRKKGLKAAEKATESPTTEADDPATGEDP